MRSTLPYANAIHYGWPAHNVKPNPFMERASRQAADRIERQILNDMDRFFARHGFR